jgi:hypothetical protein
MANEKEMVKQYWIEMDRWPKMKKKKAKFKRA